MFRAADNFSREIAERSAPDLPEATGPLRASFFRRPSTLKPVRRGEIIDNKISLSVLVENNDWLGNICRGVLDPWI